MLTQTGAVKDSPRHRGGRLTASASEVGAQRSKVEVPLRSLTPTLRSRGLSINHVQQLVLTQCMALVSYS